MKLPANLKEALLERRAFLIAPFAFMGLVALSSRKSKDQSTAGDAGREFTLIAFGADGAKRGPVTVKKVVKTDGEWRRLLSAEQFYVTRQKSTDSPFTGTYYQLHDPGLYRCVCCRNALFSSETKFDSGTGWPSFWAPIAEENIRTVTDTVLLMKRTEVLCKQCDAHLGHVFEDGPSPTNLRYCINESALTFAPHRVQG